MAMQDGDRPIIIKRRKSRGHDQPHGGAWKVAYADFVTAMMAFFLLMWLMNATTEKQRKGLSDYFNPQIPIARISGGGTEIFEGSSLIADEDMALSTDGAPGGEEKTLDHDEEQAEMAALKVIEQTLLERIEKDAHLRGFLRHVATRITDEGLVIEIYDHADAGLFIGDTAVPEPILRDLIPVIADVLAITANRIAVNGHVRSYPTPFADPSMWALSTARAQKAREMLESADIHQTRMQRVTGHADRSPVVDAASAPRNSRIEIILLRKNR